MNTEITKYKNASGNDLLESRILQLENQMQKLLMHGAYKPSDNNTHDGSLSHTKPRGNLSLSEGQMTAQMAIAMSRYSQRNS